MLRVCVSEKGAGPAAGVCLSLVCVTRDTDRRLSSGGRPCAAAMRDIWFCELGFTASSAGFGPAHVFVNTSGFRTV